MAAACAPPHRVVTSSRHLQSRRPSGGGVFTPSICATSRERDRLGGNAIPGSD